MEKGVQNYFDVVQSQILVENVNRGKVLIGKKKVGGKIGKKDKRKVTKIDKYFGKLDPGLQKKNSNSVKISNEAGLDQTKPSQVEHTDLDL